MLLAKVRWRLPVKNKETKKINCRVANCDLSRDVLVQNNGLIHAENNWIVI